MNFIDTLFVIDFLRAFWVNIGVGFVALIFGLLLGIPFAYLRASGGWIGKVIAFVSGCLRAAPVFVLLFLVFNILTQVVDASSLIADFTPAIALSIALSSYSISVVADTWLDLLKRFGAMNRQSIAVAIPIHIRIFVILVMSTSVGAAIGVREAVTLTLERIERLQVRADQIQLVLLVLLFFVIFFSIAKQFIVLLTRWINKKGG